MKNVMVIVAVLALFGSSVLLTGCPAVVAVGAAGAAAGGGYVAGQDKRSLGEQVDDVNLAGSIKREINNDPALKELDMEVQSYRGHVFLIGVKENQEQEDMALEIARRFTQTVSAEAFLLETSQKETMGGYAKDTALVAEVKTRLLRDKNIPSTRINVEAVRGHVVLLGIVDNEQIIHDAIYQASIVVGGEDRVKSFLFVGSQDQ